MWKIIPLTHYHHRQNRYILAVVMTIFFPRTCARSTIITHSGGNLLAFNIHRQEVIMTTASHPPQHIRFFCRDSNNARRKHYNHKKNVVKHRRCYKLFSSAQSDQGGDDTKDTGVSSLPSLSSQQRSKTSRLYYKFMQGVHLTNDLYFKTIFNTIPKAIIYTICIGGIIPTVASCIKPTLGAQLSRFMAILLTSLDEYTVKYIAKYLSIFLFGPIQLILDIFLIAIPSLIFLTSLVLIMIQVIMLKDVWNGELNALSIIIEVRDEIMKRINNGIPFSSVSSIASAAASTFTTTEEITMTPSINYNIDDAIQEYLTSNEPSMTKRQFSALEFILGSITEEIVFRGILLGVCGWLINRWRLYRSRRHHQQQEYNKNTNIVESDMSRAMNQDPTTEESDDAITFITKNQTLVLLTNVLFALVHLSNYVSPLRSFTTMDAITTLKRRKNEINYIYNVLLHLLRVSISVSAAFSVSQNIFVPSFVRFGIMGSIGSHLAWNLRTMYFPFFFVYWLLVRKR